jgi:hypothetical protein
MNKNNVRILKGLFKGELGELHKTFKHNGQTLYSIRMYHIGESPRDPAFYYSFATVADGEFEYIK